MPLDFQTVDVAFTQGLDTHNARKLVVPGKWDTLINLTLSADGSLTRRDGFEVLLNGQAGNWLATRNDELIIASGPDVSTVSVSGTNTAKQVAGALPYVDVARTEVIQNAYNYDAQDMAYGDGYACYVAKQYTAGTLADVVVTLVDVESGAKIIANTRLNAAIAAASPVRAVFADNAFWLLWMQTAAPNVLYCTVIATSAPTTIGTTAAIVSDANISVANFDACAFTSSLPVVAYRYADGATSVRVVSISRVGTVPTASAATNAVTEAAVTVASIEGLAVAPYANGTNLGVFLVHSAGGALAAGLVGAVLNAALAVSTAAAAIDATAPGAAGELHVTATAVGSGMQVFWDQQSSYLTAALRPLRSVVVSTVLAVTTAAYAVVQSACFRINAAEASGPQGPFIAGKAFTSGGVAFLPVSMLENYYRLGLGANTDTLSAQCAFFVLRCSVTGTPSFSVAAGALYGTMGLFDATYGGGAPTLSPPCSTPAIGTGFGICLQERGRLQLVSGINATPVGLVHLTLTPRTTAPGTNAQVAEAAYFSGGQLSVYDGQQIVQAGFPMYPEGISVVVSAPGGGTKLTVGTHQVVAVYEWTDAAGNRVQSAPSLPVTATVVNATDLITVLVPTTQLAAQSGYSAPSIPACDIVCYMTAASGTSFYRVVSDFVAPNTNSTVTSTVTVTIGSPQVMTDARLTQNELLYTQPLQAGSTLPNIPPGPMHGLGVSQKRLWGFISDEPSEFTYSQEPLPNTGLQFNPDTLGGQLPTDAGSGVRIAPLDEKTILFTERAIYVVYGTGPNASGGFSNFSEPQRIPSDVGCEDARSVVEIPDGLMFKSQKGWYLLDRGLSTRFIGEGVARYDAYPVTSAVVLEDRPEVRFSSSDASGPTLVYSYEVKGQDGVGQWSVFYMGNALHPGSVVDAVWWPATGRYVHLTIAGPFDGLMQETPGAYVDGAGLGAGTELQAVIYCRTGFLHVAALEAFQRVRRLYFTATAETALPTNGLVIGLDFDDIYAGPLSYNFTVDLSTITSFDEQAVDVRHHLAVQKCKSVAFAFLEGGSADETGVPLTGIQAIALEVGRKRGLHKLPSTQTVG